MVKLELLPLFVVVLVSMLGVGEGGLRVRIGRNGSVEEGEILDYVVSIAKHFGQPEFAVENKRVMMMSLEEGDEFCWEERPELRDFNDSILIIPRKVQLCSRMGKEDGIYDWLEDWCWLNATLVIVPPMYYPGILWNYHDGNEFAEMYEAKPWTRECRIAQALSTPESMYLHDLMLSGEFEFVLGNLTTDPNKADALFRAPFTVFMFRVLSPILYFLTAWKSVRFFLVRTRQNKVNFVHRIVLPINFVTGIVLGVVEAIGHRFITDNMPHHHVIIFFSCFFATSVATDFLIGIQYRLVRQRAFQMNTDHARSSAKSCFLVVAVILIMLDFVFLGFIMAGTNESFMSIEVIFPSVFAALQIWIIFWLLRETLKLVHVMEEMMEYQDGSSAVTIQEQKLLKRIRFWVLMSCLSSATLITALILYATRFHHQSPINYLVVMGTLSYSKAVTILAQTNVLAPPPRVSRAAMHKVINTEMSSNT